MCWKVLKVRDGMVMLTFRIKEELELKTCGKNSKKKKYAELLKLSGKLQKIGVPHRIIYRIIFRICLQDPNYEAYYIIIIIFFFDWRRKFTDFKILERRKCEIVQYLASNNFNRNKI